MKLIWNQVWLRNSDGSWLVILPSIKKYKTEMLSSKKSQYSWKERAINTQPGVSKCRGRLHQRDGFWPGLWKWLTSESNLTHQEECPRRKSPRTQCSQKTFSLGHSMFELGWGYTRVYMPYLQWGFYKVLFAWYTDAPTSIPPSMCTRTDTPAAAAHALLWVERLSLGSLHCLASEYQQTRHSAYVIMKIQPKEF